MKATKGFTIVELLVVIVVIAILAAITIVAYNGIQARATDAGNLSNANAITKAIAAYKIDNNNVPPICSAGDGQGCALSTISSQLVSTYLSQLPNDSAYPYYYVGTSTGDGAWSIRMYKRSTAAYCKFGVYPSSLDSWWSSAPKC
jgi:prepilin-type N-terminal cleavage/methylation domain-containing protein